MTFILRTSTKTWSRAKKTQGIRAKAMINLIVDRSVVNKFLIDTLEGREPISENNIFCIGGAGDPWQQTSKALLKKYDVKAIDEDGWMVCEPKPENEVQYFELDGSMIGMDSSSATSVLVEGLWGETIDGIPNLQRCDIGDFICRQTHDHTDQWVVRRKLFLNTYSKLGS